MITLSKKQNGFSVVEAAIIVLVVAVLGFAGYRVFTRKKDQPKQENTQQSSQGQSSGPINWMFNGQNNEWMPSSAPPKCPDPLFKQSPVDVSKAVAVLYPGQYRGFNYKPHGGFGFAASATEVRLPIDAKITTMVRYIEQGEVQYLVTFTADCGIVIKFDHLYTLSSEFQKIAETTPEPKVDDTRSQPLQNQPSFKAGDPVATAVGHPKTSNFGMDFGVLDLHQQNEISKNSEWRALHMEHPDSDWYGVCWFDLLPSADAAKVKAMKPTDPTKPFISDYCPAPAGNTLQHNGGKPTNG